MHLSEPMPQILDKRTFVVTSSWPLVYSFTISLIIDISSLVFLCSVLPHSIPKSQSIFKLPLIYWSIAPCIGTLTLRLAIWVHSIVPIPVIEQLHTLTMFIPIFDIPIVLRKRWPDVSLSLRFVELPTPTVKLISGLPFSNPMFHAINKTAVVDIPISPNEDAILIFRFIIQKLPNKKIPIDIFHSIAIFTIILELPFIEPQKTIFVQKHPVPMIEIIASLSEIQSVATFEENQFVVLLQMIFGYLLYLLVRVLE